MLKNLMIMAYLASHPHGEGLSPDAFRLSSPSIDHSLLIPAAYTCQGENVSIPLSWSGAPKKTRSFAVIMLDEDAPRDQWYHWALFNIPPTQTSLPENVAALHTIQAARNSWNHFYYDGPCPQAQKHHYAIRLYALDTELSRQKNISTLELREAMRGHIIGTSTLRLRSAAATQQNQHG